MTRQDSTKNGQDCVFECQLPYFLLILPTQDQPEKANHTSQTNQSHEIPLVSPLPASLSTKPPIWAHRLALALPSVQYNVPHSFACFWVSHKHMWLWMTPLLWMSSTNSFSVGCFLFISNFPGGSTEIHSTLAITVDTSCWPGVILTEVPVLFCLRFAESMVS